MAASVESNSLVESNRESSGELLLHPPSSTNFLQSAPPLSYDDFDPTEIKLNLDDIDTIVEFEKLWKEFLQSRPDVLPTGKKGKRIERLENKLLAIQNSKHNVEAELKRQLEFFENANVKLESNFERLKIDAEKEEETMMSEMGEHLEAVGTSVRHLEANGDWELFFEALEDAVKQSDVKTLPGDGLSTLLGISSATHTTGEKKASSALKPSAKAMFLNNAASESDVHINSRDFLLRAFRIDNTLLLAQVKMLHRDLERIENGMKTQDLVGRFLTEHNIWGVLSSSSAGNSVAASKVTRPNSTFSHNSPRAGRV